MIKPSTQDDAVSVISQISHNESFNIKFSRSDDNFPYQKVSFESFDLPPKLEKYPSDVRWVSPSISPRFARYFSAIALDNKHQRTLVYIWELDHKLKKASIKHHYKFDKVKVFDVIFVSTQEQENSQFDTHSFGILTENKFFYYHMETGSLINSTKINDKMIIPELLAPAGSYAKFLTALQFGADAVYLGGKQFSLRTFADNFTDEELEQAVALAHEKGKKI